MDKERLTFKFIFIFILTVFIVGILHRAVNLDFISLIPIIITLLQIDALIMTALYVDYDNKKYIKEELHKIDKQIEHALREANATAKRFDEAIHDLNANVKNYKKLKK